MKRVVWKFTVPVDGEPHTVELPGAGYDDPVVPVLVATQEGPSSVQLWVEVIDGHPSVEERKLRVYGTGHEIPNGAAHVGSTVAARVAPGEYDPMGLGSLVWHLYDVTEAEAGQ